MTNNKDKAINKASQELITQFILDLNFLESITSNSHVFQRISEVRDKWEVVRSGVTINGKE